MTDGPKSIQGIMLSSTFTDLVEHRQAAIEAIQHHRFFPNVMEFNGASIGPDVLDKSLEMAAGSAAYVLVIGHRYGQIPADPVRNPHQKSITELEFDEAIGLGLPILLFVMSEKHPVVAGEWETSAPRMRKLKAFIARAKRQDPRDIRSAVERVWGSFDSKEDFASKCAIAIGKLARDFETVEVISEKDAFAREVLARLDRLTIPERAVRGAIARFIDVRPDAAEDEVVQAVERFETDYRGLQEQVAAITTLDNHITSLKAGAEQALHDGDLDTARRLYGEAATVAREKATEPVRATAQLLEAEARAHLLALDWKAGNKAWADAAAMLTAFDVAAGESIVWRAAEALAEHGDHFARGDALHAAADRWRCLVEDAADRGDPARIASLQNNLGTVLKTQGERTGGEDGLTLLADAIAAYRAALVVHTETDMPAQWAMTQNNLGTALQAQGERTGGGAGLALLADAAAAYRAALTVRTEAAMSAEWAMTQNNLGVTLKTQGERTGGEAGLALFADAAAVHRAALTVLAKAALGTDWALAQNGLGNALERQGERTAGDAGLALLTDAVASYGAALTVYTEATMPADWAMTQNNLGVALHKQGERTPGEPGLTLFTDAAAACRAALTVYIETTMPAHWAMAQNNLGNALLSWGERTGGEAGLELIAEAVTAYCNALTIRTETAMPAAWAMTLENLALAHESMADLGDSPRKNLCAAQAALRNALGIYTPEHMSYDYETATEVLARVDEKLAALKG